MASPLPGTPHSSPSRSVWKAVGCVVAVMILVTAGWPLVSRLLADDQRLAPGTLLKLGPGRDAASLRVPNAGWSLSRSNSDPNRAYVLSHRGRGAGRSLKLTASFVDVGDPADVPLLWSGLRKLVAVSDAAGRLGPPRPVRGADGTAGSTGALTSRGRSGTATVWVAADGGSAVEVTVLADAGAGSAAALAAARPLVRSVAFPAFPPLSPVSRATS